MLINANIVEKQMGAKLLFRDLQFKLQEGARVGLIGRNGIGKSTLFGILTGEDMDFIGKVEKKRNLQVVMTAQEHFAVDEMTAVEYILSCAPDYFSLKEIIDTYPLIMDESIVKIQTYTNALEKFIAYNYYTIEEDIIQALHKLQIDSETALRPLKTLSGGQKRFVELVRVTFTKPDLILLDEPTNHLDYHGKKLFLLWLQNLKTACCIISHDRDVLSYVESMIEIKDYRAFTYPGNYGSYIRQNGTNTVTQVSQYETALKRLAMLHAQVQTANARKAGASNSRPRIIADRLQREYDTLKESIEKPSFWIDRETTAALGKDSAESYGKYKAKTITIGASTKDRHKHQLLSVNKLAIGYKHSLFEPISFRLEHGDRIVLRGRNGAGKSTLIKAILSAVQEPNTDINIFSGSIEPSANLRVGIYEQEIDGKYLAVPLGKAITNIYGQVDLRLSDQQLNGILARYLFDPVRDKALEVRYLSGGQKARFQLIRMLCENPNLLILDEPTNHLDLPSIEELEDAVRQYPGAVIYVSHDSHFIDHIGGRVVQVGKA